MPEDGGEKSAGRTLVAVPAHADDAELNAGGALAKWAAGGGTVHLVMTTDNCSGLMIPPGEPESAKRRLPPGATSKIRHREQEAAAKLIGAEVHYLDYPQRHYWDEERGVRIKLAFAYDRPAPSEITSRPPLLAAAELPKEIDRLGELLVGLKPALVLPPPPLDRDPEHHAPASRVWRALHRRREKFVDVPLRFWSPGDSCYDGLFAPEYDVIEEISDWFEKKAEMCAAHASQFSAFRQEMIARRARAWGKRLGVAYAEPYRTARFSNRETWFTDI